MEAEVKTPHYHQPPPVPPSFINRSAEPCCHSALTLTLARAAQGSGRGSEPGCSPTNACHTTNPSPTTLSHASEPPTLRCRHHAAAEPRLCEALRGPRLCPCSPAQQDKTPWPGLEEPRFQPSWPVQGQPAEAAPAKAAAAGVCSTRWEVGWCWVPAGRSTRVSCSSCRTPHFDLPACTNPPSWPDAVFADSGQGGVRYLAHEQGGGGIVPVVRGWRAGVRGGLPTMRRHCS